MNENIINKEFIVLKYKYSKISLFRKSQLPKSKKNSDSLKGKT